jgi:hypothetical protein
LHRYNFNVTVSPTLTTTCSSVGTTNPVLSVVQETACGEGTGVWWSQSALPGTGFELKVTYIVSGVTFTGAHTITQEEIVWTNQQSPTGTVQTYVGPSNFTLTAS